LSWHTVTHDFPPQQATVIIKLLQLDVMSMSWRCWHWHAYYWLLFI